MKRYSVIFAFAGAFAAVAVLAVAAVGGTSAQRPSSQGLPAQNGPGQPLAPDPLGLKTGNAEAVAIAGDTGFLANQGFKSVYQPPSTTGIYCLRTLDATIKPSNRVPLLTVEWGTSSGGNDLTAFWDQGPDDCKTKEFEVRTYHTSTNTPTDDVTFVIVIP